jgi:outer membrane lipoprotein-sorting protein
MNLTWIQFLVGKYIFFLTLCFASNPIDGWIDEHKAILKEDIKSVSFQLKIETQYYSGQNDTIISGKITVGRKNKFRFEMGPRTVVSDGKVWKSYDSRTDQIFIQEPDKQLEKSLFSWTKIKKIKALPVKQKKDGGYQIKLLGKGNDVRVYFIPNSNTLKSIVIIQGDMRSELSHITLVTEKILNLEIGNKNSSSFDLR